MRGTASHRCFLGVQALLLLAAIWIGTQAPAQESPDPAAPAPAAIPAGPVVESMKILCDGKVKTDGVASLVFTPAGGAPYGVDRYDDDKIKVEGKKGAKFSLSLGGQTATGLRIELK